jgi:VanZ family protein
MNYKTIVPVLFIAESVFLFCMSFQPGYAVPSFHIPFFRPGDLEHFLTYLVYGFLGYKTFSLKYSPRKSLMISLVVCGLFGGFTEAMQAFVPSRFADPLDWLVDVTGSFVGIFISTRIKRL